MNATQRTICAGLVVASLARGGSLWAEESRRDLALEINRANNMLRGGDVDGAIGAYRAAQAHAPENADLSYNTAVAQYRKGDVAAAEHLFQSAAATENDMIAARARYNLGNCDYASALQLAEKDRPGAIRELESAIANYRSALEVEPSDADARANIELASQLIDKLREEKEQQEQQKQQQENQKQDQQQKQEQQDQQQSKDQQQNEENQQQSQSSDGGDQQDEKSTENQQPAQDKPQQGEEQSKDEQSKEQQPNEEKSPQDKSQSQQQSKEDAERENQQQSSPADQPQESKPQPSQPQSQQDRQQQASKMSPQEQDEAPQPADDANDKKGKQPPQGTLTAADEKAAQNNKQDEQGAIAFDPEKDGEMTKQEAEKMLQSIRDRDMVRRLRRQAAEQSRHVPVDRDW